MKLNTVIKWLGYLNGFCAVGNFVAQEWSAAAFNAFAAAFGVWYLRGEKRREEKS